MLTLNISLPNKENDWVYLDTQNGIIAVTAKEEGNQLRLVIEAPKSVKISRKSIIQKEQQKQQKGENENDVKTN